MKQLISPDWTINSIYQITPADILQQGFKGMIVDLDNTLLAWNEYELSQRMADWVSQMIDAQVKIYLLSNNNPKRVGKVIEALDIPHKARALKPLRGSFQEAIRFLDLPIDQIVVIGDQIITDVIGAKRNQLKVILVKPLVDHDNVYTWFNRSVEKLLLRKIGLVRSEDWGDSLERF
ncbi:hypothetical protein SAMN04488558_11060 [Ignavigranum ruoffiae]|uniref:Uncharacterized protein n=1 Tax=Ignavigranum ruoffiae TaxID=89093 RepID=A0A1H9FXE3_9LACT|nr:YqeG family HAD IIIA-type phosphatase [Ignavigranum ruoffiae]SEQ42562.1 hypothetical protein SAMN04488558_11060 [Ignavigranum ruoffiae]